MAGRPTDSGNRTFSLLVYGSLMHSDERLQSGFGQGGGIPVILTGFARDFSQRPSWRSGRGSARGVLRVRAGTDCSINAILVPHVSWSLLEHLDRRERGYLRQPVDPQRVTPFGDVASAIPTDDVTFVYEGRSGRHAPDLTPNPDYLSLCLAAARQWGTGFEQMFLATTSIAGHAMNAPHWRSGFNQRLSRAGPGPADRAGSLKTASPTVGPRP